MPDTYSLTNELLVASKVRRISLDSTAGLSALRDMTTTTGSGTVTAANGLITAATGATVASEAVLDTVCTGFHQGTVTTLVTVGVTLSAAPTGQQAAFWGYMDDNNGAGFGVDATSAFVFTRNAGTDTKVLQANWNVDKMDGTGTSTLTLNVAHSALYQINLLWSGTVEFAVLVPVSGVLTPVVVHRVGGNTFPLTQDSAVPVRVQVINGTTASNLAANVTSREVAAVRSDTPPSQRYVSHLIDGLAPTTSFITVANVRRKTTAPYNRIHVNMNSVESSTSNSVFFRLIQNASLDTPSWVSPSNVLPAETAVEVDTSDTSPSDTTHVVYQWIAPAGFYIHQLPEGLEFCENIPYTLQVKSLSVTGSAVVNIKWRESW